MNTPEQFDSIPFDPPVQSAVAKMAKHSRSAHTVKRRVWAFAPHVGAELILDKLIDQNPLSDNLGKYLFAEVDEWFTHGGDLMLHMGEINARNNAAAQRALDQAEVIEWITEQHLHRWREIALVELTTGELYNLSLSNTVSVNMHRYLQDACAHATAWSRIMELWIDRWPGEIHSVSDYFTEKSWPYPHQAEFGAEENSQNEIFNGAHIRDMLHNAVTDGHLTVNINWIAGYFQRLPLAVITDEK